MPPLDATFAVANSTWTMRDSAGYEIPTGTEVAVAVTGDERIGFAVAEPVTVPPGSTTTAAGGVELVALEAGAEGSGLTGIVSLITPLDGPVAIALVGVTQGGRDDESDPDYLDRLTRRLRRLTFGVVRPEDVQDLVRDIPGIARALVLDNYIPAGPGGSPPAQTNAAAALTVVPIDAAGLPVGNIIEGELVAELEASREQGFIFSVMEPTYTTVNATFSHTVFAGFDPATVTTAAVAALTAYLSPSTWGLPPFGDQALWLPKNKVRFGEVYAVLNAVDGLDEVTALTLDGTANVDITLAGPAPLPLAGTIAGQAV
ncbi:MAG: baseplate J/gp47 family protein [Chloroflexi bacterium]|nr:baseplate J/gp47 family protein [Chloroflexota bacterium]